MHSSADSIVGPLRIVRMVWQSRVSSPMMVMYLHGVHLTVSLGTHGTCGQWDLILLVVGVEGRCGLI